MGGSRKLWVGGGGVGDEALDRGTKFRAGVGMGGWGGGCPPALFRTKLKLETV